MRIIRDADTVEFTDGSGDKLILRSMPRQRDLIASDEVARDEAFEQLEALKKLGIDTDKALADASASEVKAAESDVALPRVREFRLKALAVKLIVGGEAIGGNAIIDAYHDMDSASAAWVDAKVAEVWAGASLSESDTRAV